jgi:outer membrane receptor protein involved in Fe transport
MHRQKLPTLKPLALAIALSATSSALQAQDSPLIEVLVTAQKRSENLQDVPISRGLSNRWAPIKMVFTTAAPSS